MPRAGENKKAVTSISVKGKSFAKIKAMQQARAKAITEGKKPAGKSEPKASLKDGEEAAGKAEDEKEKKLEAVAASAKRRGRGAPSVLI